MTKNLFIAFAAFVALATSAQAKTNPYCEALQTAESWNFTDEEYDLSEGSSQNLDQLPRQLKKQILTFVREESKQWNEGQQIETVAQAVAYLREGSEAGEVYVDYFEAAGKNFARIAWYPGGNPYGAIFKTGTTWIVAAIADDDLICR